MKNAVDLLLVELILLVSTGSVRARIDGAKLPSESSSRLNLPEVKRASHQRALAIQDSRRKDRNKCPRSCQEKGQRASDFQFCASYCEPCVYVGFEDELCLQIAEEYEDLTNSTSPWLISTTTDDSHGSLCPLFFTPAPGHYWYSSDPFCSLQKVRIISFYNNTFPENQTIVGDSFQIWTQNELQISGPYLPPVVFEQDVDGIVVEPGQSVKLEKTIDLSDAPSYHNTIFMRVYTIPRGFAPSGFKLMSTQITCFDGADEEAQEPPAMVCPDSFVAAPWGFDTNPFYQNVRAMEITADYQNQLNQSQTILAKKFQVWTASTSKENYDLPPLTFEPDPDGWVVEPGEIVTLSFTIDLRDTPDYHSIVSVQLSTLESGPTLPSEMEIVSSTIVCVS